MKTLILVGALALSWTYAGFVGDRPPVPKLAEPVAPPAPTPEPPEPVPRWLQIWFDPPSRKWRGSDRSGQVWEHASRPDLEAFLTNR